MSDVQCRKCKALVLRISDNIGRVARRQQINMTWPDGRQVVGLFPQACPSCGDAFMSINAKTAETLGADDLLLAMQTRRLPLN